MNPPSKFVVPTTVLLVIAFVLPALGQQNQRRPGVAILAKERELQNRSTSVERLKNGAGSPGERQDARLAFTQIREDFKRIQILNNKLMLAASSVEPLDLTFVGKSASEIKKLAGQLKANLALPEPEKVPKHPPGEQLKPLFEALDRQIMEFVNNPIFKAVNVINPQMSSKARRSLDEIIELSEQVKESSGKLRKARSKK